MFWFFLFIFAVSAVLIVIVAINLRNEAYAEKERMSHPKVETDKS